MKKIFLLSLIFGTASYSSNLKLCTEYVDSMLEMKQIGNETKIRINKARYYATAMQQGQEAKKFCASYSDKMEIIKSEMKKINNLQSNVFTY